MDSTEMLINGQWETGTIHSRRQKCFDTRLHESIALSFLFFFLLTLGPPLPRPLVDFSMLEMLGDVYVFGGRVSTGKSQSFIFFPLKAFNK